jgi:Fungal specific transcription factor domain
MNDWSHLPSDLQFYLGYFCENVTHNHYAMKHDSEDFLRTDFLDAALRNKALLHAVVGFSAFQHTLTNPRGRMQDFLQYYNKAVSFLLGLLTGGKRHNLGILLTILQLATIEVSRHFPPSFNRLLIMIGIPRRLDQPFGSSEGCL